MAATVSALGTALASTTNATSYTVTVTPAVGDLIVFHWRTSGTVVTPGISADGNAGVTTFYNAIVNASNGTSDMNGICVANQFATSATATTITLNFTADAGTGCIIAVYKVTGMSKNGSTAVVQTGLTQPVSSGTAPSITFSATPQSGNPVLSSFGCVTATATGLSPPTGFTEGFDTGYSTPSNSMESNSINSGSPKTLTWSAGAPSAGIAMAVELDSSGSGASGTLATTLDNSTMSATATETMSGTLATTLANNVMAASGKAGASGTLATTLAATVMAASGTSANPVTGTLSTTLAGVTESASGTETISGTLASTLAPTVMAGSGKAGASGTLAASVGPATMSATATETISGTEASTLAGATMSASGKAGASGTLSTTLANTAMAASGTVTVVITGTLATTLSGVSMAASGKAGASGTMSATAGPVAMSATAKETISGTEASTLSGATMAATGAAGAVGSLHVTLAGVTESTTAKETMQGPLASIMSGATLAGSGAAGASGTLSSSVGGVTLGPLVVTNGIVNPSMVGGSGSTLPTGYVKYPGTTGTYAVVTSPWDATLQAIQMTIVNSGDDTRILANSHVPVYPGQVVTFIMRYTGNASRVNQLLLWTDINGAFVSAASQAPAPDANGWSTFSATVPAGVYNVQAQLYAHTTDLAGDTHTTSQWFMCVLDRAYADGYFNGDTADTSLYNYAWTGTVNNSTQTRTNLNIEQVSGPLATTLAGATLAASGSVFQGDSGTMAVTLAGATLSGSGFVTPTGTLATTLVGATMSATATETERGTLATTLGGATLAGTGWAEALGPLAVTLANTTMSGAGKETIAGSLASTLYGAALAASGFVPAVGTLTVTLDGVTLRINGVVLGGPVPIQVWRDGAWQSAEILGVSDGTNVNPVEMCIGGTMQTVLAGPKANFRGGLIPTPVTGNLATTLEDAHLWTSPKVQVYQNGSFLNAEILGLSDGQQVQPLVVATGR